MDSPDLLPRLPDPARSRAVVIGVASYDDPKLPALPSVTTNAQQMYDILTSPHGIGLPTKHCQLLLDPRNPLSVLKAIGKAADEAEDLLFVYYAGHGLLGLDHSAHLAVTDSSSDRKYAARTGIRFTEIKQELGLRAMTKVIVVDSCYSAQAIAPLMGSDPRAEIVSTFRGHIVAASTDKYKTASAPEGDRFTAFTAELVNVLKFGIANRGDVLTFHDVFKEVRARLVTRGSPEPVYAYIQPAGDLGFVRNTTPTGTTAKPALQHKPGSPEATAKTDASTTFYSAYREVNRRCMFLAGAGLITSLALGLDQKQNTLSPYAMAVCGLLFAFIHAVRIWLPNSHTLEINADGLVLRTLRQNYTYLWGEVGQVRLDSRPSGDFDLVVALRPGITPPRPTVFTHGPTNGATKNEFVLVRARQLLARPTQLDDALRTFAGTARVGNQEIYALRAEESAAQEAERFVTNRAVLGVAGGFLAAIGLIPLTTLATTTSLLVAATAVLIALVSVVPGLLLLVCAHNPAELRLDKRGLRYTRHGALVELTWREIEKIGLVRFLRQASGPRYLRVRHSKGGAPQDLMLVDLISLTTSADRLSAAITRFSGSRWEDSYRPDRGVRTTASTTEFHGRAFGWRTLVVPLLAFIAFATLVGGSWFPVDLADELGTPTSVMGFWLGFAGAFGLFLATRHRCTLVMTDAGFEMRLRRKRKQVSWSDVRHVQLVTMLSEHKNKRTGKHSSSTAIMVTPSRDDVISRPWQSIWFLQPFHGIVTLCPVDSFLLYLDATDATLDRALRRHAGPDRWLPPASRSDISPKAAR